MLKVMFTESNNLNFYRKVANLLHYITWIQEGSLIFEQYLDGIIVAEVSSSQSYRNTNKQLWI